MVDVLLVESTGAIEEDMLAERIGLGTVRPDTQHLLQYLVQHLYLHHGAVRRHDRQRQLQRLLRVGTRLLDNLVRRAVDEQHRHRSGKVVGTENVDEDAEERLSSVAWHVSRRIGEDAYEHPRLAKQRELALLGGVGSLERADERRDNALQHPLHHREADASSRCSTVAPTNVKIGMTLCSTASGATLAILASRSSACWNVCGLLEHLITLTITSARSACATSAGTAAPALIEPSMSFSMHAMAS